MNKKSIVVCEPALPDVSIEGNQGFQTVVCFVDYLSKGNTMTVVIYGGGGGGNKRFHHRVK